MAEISKQALTVQNNTEFPNNNAGAIAPSNLRSFNVNMIDSLVDEISYNADSASWNRSINALNTFTSSQQPSFTALNAFTASQLTINSGVNTFTQSATGRLNNLEAYTASFTTSVGIYDEGTFVNNANAIDFNGNGITASFISGKASVTVDFTQLNASTASQQVSINNLNTNSASVNTSITNLNASSASQQVSINALNVFTASQSTASIVSSISQLNASSASQQVSIDALNVFTASASGLSTGSLLVTASFNNGTRNLTFTKGNNTTFAVNIPDVSGSTINTGSFVTTSSFNAYTASTNTFTASANTSITNLNTTTASLLIETQNLELFSASALVSISNLNASSASQQVSINALNTNSASVNTSITNVNSATASLFTSVNNINTTTASLLIETSNLETFSASALISISNLNSATSSLFTSASNALVTASVSGTTMTFTKGNGTTFNVTLPTGSGGTSGGATLGANTFTGSQTISLNGGKFAISDPTNPSFGEASFGISGASGGLVFRQSSSIVMEGAFPNSLTFYGTSSFNKGIKISDSEFVNGAELTYNTTLNELGLNIQGSNKASLNVEGDLTASLQSGYVWVGNASGRTTTVATSSFGSTISTGSFAILGANQIFTGNNTFTGNTVVSQSATFGTASFNGPVVMNKGINSNVQITGSLTVNGEVRAQGATPYFTAAGNTANSGAQFPTHDVIITNNNNEFGGFGIYKEGQYPNTTFVGLVGTAYSPQYGSTTTPMIIANGNNPGGNDTAIAWTSNGQADHWKKSNFKYGADITGSTSLSGSLIVTGSSRFGGNQTISGSVLISGSIELFTRGGDGFGFKGKSLFLSTSVQTGITVESPIHFYKMTKGDMYITANVDDPTSTGSMNITVANNRNLNISASSTIVRGKFTNFLPTASAESTTDLFKLPTFLASNGTTYPYAGIGLNDYASTGLDQVFAIEYANDSFEKYSAVYVGPSRTQFLIGKGSGYDYDVIELLDNNNNTSTAKIKSNTIILEGPTQVTGSLSIQSGSAFFANGNRQFNVGAFQSNVSQSGSANVSQSIQLEVTDISQGVSIVSGSRITVANSGTYNIQFSAQVDRSSGAGADQIYIWLKKNGNNVANTAGVITIDGNTAAAKTIAAWNYVVNAAANDYYELCWQSPDANIVITRLAASGNIPSVPSVILTVTQVR